MMRFFSIGLLIFCSCVLGCDSSKTASPMSSESKSASVASSPNQPGSQDEEKKAEGSPVKPATATEPVNPATASSDKAEANPEPGTETKTEAEATANSPQAQSTEPKSTEPKSTEPKSTEPKSTEPKSAEPKSTEKRAAPKSGVVHAITFDDLNCGMQADIVFRPWMLTERVKELDGQRVRIAGYMHPDAKQKGITEFILLRNTECKFGPAGQADHLIQVRLDPGITTSFTTSPIEVVGQLTFKPFNGPDGNTWAIFEMTGESVGAPRHRPPTGKDSRPVRGG